MEAKLLCAPSQCRKENNIVVTTLGKQKLSILCPLLFLNFPYRHLWIKSMYKLCILLQPVVFLHLC